MTFSDQKIPKNPQKYFCEKCNYITCNKKDYAKHLATQKHQIVTFSDQKSPKIPLREFVCECGKKYKYKQGLSYHKKRCDLCNSTNEKTGDIEVSNITENTIIKELKDIIVYQQKQISELIPRVGNNNTTHTQNNKFNINVFLNEKCRDAINMSDFIKTIAVSMQQLDFTKENGLANGLSRTIIDNINKLSIYERPLHCTDVKRETLYIKEEDKWEKDESQEKIKKAIKNASCKNYNALQDWKEKNPDFMDNEEKSDYFTNTIRIIGKTDNTTEEKIIKNLCKETYIKDSMD